MRGILLSVAAGLIGSAALAEPVAVKADAAQYLLTMELSDGGRIVGKPRLTVLENEPARVEIGEADGSHYSLRLTLTPQSGETVAVASQMTIAPVGRMQRTVSPALVVALDRPSAVEFGAESPTDKPFRVNFTVSRVARR